MIKPFPKDLEKNGSQGPKKENYQKMKTASPGIHLIYKCQIST